MAKDQVTKAIDGLVQEYVSLGNSAAIIVRKLKRTPNPDLRRKLLAELRSLDKKRGDILNELDHLTR